MPSPIVCPFVVGSFFYTNISQSTCLMDSPSSQLDPYTPPNDYHTFYACSKTSQQTKPWLELIFFLCLEFFKEKIKPALGVFSNTHRIDGQYLI